MKLKSDATDLIRAFLLNFIEMRLNNKREDELTPKRLEYAVKKISEKGFNAEIQPCNQKIIFERAKNKTVVLFVYSGWWSGKGIGSGRGIENLLKLL